MFGIGTALYLFLAGGGAGLAIVSAVLGWTLPYGERPPRDLSILDRKTQIISIVLVALGAAFLLADLTRPQHFSLVFNNMESSILSLGALILTAFLFAQVARAAVLWAFRHLPRYAKALIDAVLIVLALLVVGYTGVLLMQMRAIPFWGSPLVVALFVVSSLSCGTAIALLLGSLSLRRRALPRPFFATNVAEKCLLLVELALVAAYLSTSLGAGGAAAESATRLLSGDLAWAFWGLVVVGVALPMVPFPGNAQHVSMASIAQCLGTIVGCFLLRYCVVAAGVRVLTLG